MLANSDIRLALLCAWNCTFGGIALLMGMVATLGLGMEMMGSSVKHAASTIGLSVCEMQIDAKQNAE